MVQNVNVQLYIYLMVSKCVACVSEQCVHCRCILYYIMRMYSSLSSALFHV